VSDIRESYVGVGGVLTDISRRSRCDRARSTSDSRGIRIFIGGVVTVEPEHVYSSIVPQTHDEGHSVSKRASHLLHSTSSGESVLLVEEYALGLAEVVSDGVKLFSSNSSLRVVNEFTVLDVLPLDLNNFTGVCAIFRNELSDDGKGLARVDSEVCARAEEVVETVAVRSPIATRFIAVTRGGTLISFTSLLSIERTRMGGESLRNLVSFPDIHLSAARAVFTAACLVVPAVRVRLSVDELDVGRALSIAVTGSKIGSGIVVSELALATVSGHL